MAHTSQRQSPMDAGSEDEGEVVERGDRNGRVDRLLHLGGT
jgi:hypothetical protein